MTTATITPPRKKPTQESRRITVNVMERLDFSESNVDRANCIIKNVKILGQDSPNKHGMDVEGTDYLESAHVQVRQLYEGMQTNVGHPPRNDPDKERDPRDRNGVLFNVKAGGPRTTYGDWKLIPSHPMTKILLDCASDPQLHNQFALSHNAKGYGNVREGRYQISEVPKVRSVDVVCCGGTNESLFESRETTMKKKFRDLVESAHAKVKSRLTPLLELYEDDSAPLGDTMVEPPAPPAEDPAGEGASHMDHLGSLLKALIDDVKSGKLTGEECCEKILAAVKVMEETKEAPPAAGATVEDEEAEETEEEKAKADKDKAAMESREREELLQFRGEKKVRDLCESKQFTPTRLQIKAMIPLNEADCKAMIDELKTLKPVANRGGANQPRTSSSRAADVQESVAKNQEVDFSDKSEEAMKKRAKFFCS